MAKRAALDLEDVLLGTVRAVFLDLPLVTVKRGFGAVEKGAVADAMWKGYDATTLLGRASIERLYQSGFLGALLGRSVPTLLRLQRLNSAAMGAFFAVLWRAAGVATASEITALREEVRALAAAVTAQGKKIDALGARSAHSKPRVARKVVPSITAA